jgi:hypothetical protein
MFDFFSARVWLFFCFLFFEHVWLIKIVGLIDVDGGHGVNASDIFQFFLHFF